MGKRGASKAQIIKWKGEFSLLFFTLVLWGTLFGRQILPLSSPGISFDSHRLGNRKPVIPELSLKLRIVSSHYRMKEATLSYLVDNFFM